MHYVWAVVCIQNKQELTKYLKLYLIFEVGFLKLPVDEFLERVFSAGVTAIQLRCKGLPPSKLYKIGLIIKKHLHRRDILFIVNDRADIACLLHSDGLHIGLTDIPLPATNKHFKNLIIGYSCHSERDIDYAVKFGADYIGIGSVFPTNTKDDVEKILGVNALEKLAATSKLPAVAIGGINEKNIELIKNTSINGVAISSAICASDHPELVIKKIRDIF